MSSVQSRWSTYVLESGKRLGDLFEAHLGGGGRSICFILGCGFDPRMNAGLERVLEVQRNNPSWVLVLEFDEGSASPSRQYAPWVDENMRVLRSLVDGRAGLVTRRVQIWAQDGRRIGPRSAASLFRSPDEFAAYTDIFVDVSSLPRGIFYPLIAKLLYLVESDRTRAAPLNLFVLAAENPDLDRRIIDEGIDEDADYVHPFRSGAERMATAGQPKVWIPVLGEGQGLQLRRLYDLVTPQEICPVLPSASLDPRRADALISEYHELLFDQLRVEPRNFIHASERNPFEVYRQIRRTVIDYDRVLKPLGGCRAIVSSVSTKLLSLGALLAAYELKRANFDIGIAHIDAHGYRIEGEATVDSLKAQTVLFGLWVSGECYA